MKDKLLHKVRTFRTANELINLLDPKEKHSPKVNVSLPSNEAESTLYDIWKNLMGHDNFGVRDDFFQVGGNSLKVVQLASRIIRKFLVRIQLTDLFFHPTIQQQAAHILQKNEHVPSASINAINQRPTYIPLSFSQERLWFIDRLEGSVQYHTPEVLRLTGEIDIDALSFALQNIIKRHEVLRTVIRENNGIPYQHIKDESSWQLPVINNSQYQDFPDLQQYIDSLINHPFDLSTDDMIRAHLIILNEHEHLLVITIHHIASDGWSISIFLKELVELYDSYIDDRPALMEPLEIQYADYAIWQRQHFQGELLDNKINYWKNKLTDLEPLQLPTDYPRLTTLSTKGALVQSAIDNGLSKELEQLSNKQGSTLYMTLLSAFKVLLCRYSGQHDICVGSPTAGRQQQELEGLIGFFVSTLALRSTVASDISFIEFLQHVKTTTLEAYEHQEAPFEKVVNAVVKKRDLSRTPIFQVMFALQNTPDIPELNLQNLNLSRQDYTHDTSKFDLSFFITETATGLRLSAEYNTDLYKESTITQMIAHFNQLLTTIVKDPHQKIGKLSILTPSEEHQLLVEFNDTDGSYSKDKTVVDLFEEQAKKTPDNIAVVFEKDKLTYNELNKRANQLAHYLQSKGVRQETLVPICIERSLEMIVGVLAILKTGGVYVPIDPEYPEERINYMIKDTSAPIILTDSQSRKRLQLKQGIEVIEIDNDWSVIDKQSVTNPKVVLSADALLYIIYTSGSTGKPKGVKMPGRSLVNLLNWQQKQFKNKNRRVLQFASLNFDVSFQDIFSTICLGSSLYLIRAERRIDMVEVVKDIKQYGITHLFIPFIVLKNLAEHILPIYDDTFPLEEIIVAGEQLKLTEDIHALIKKSGIRLINQYGPTETHVVTSYTINADDELLTLPPIGKPIDNCRLYILDNSEEPVPIGITGELYIGGVPVANGYLNQPELTAKKFITDKFSKQVGAKLYRTGDLARWMPDGNIEYLGRIDDQVKIRGYRIEPGEIEGVLQECDLVRQGVVLAREDSNGNKRLIGYVVPEREFNKEALKSYLESKLPNYMIPVLWVPIEKFPVTSNGKIDRKALPDPDTDELATDQYVAPGNDLEKKLIKIWRDVLDVKRIGVHDNFFELGGHSLLAVRVVSAMRIKLKIEVAIKDLFLHPTIATIAKHIENNKIIIQLPEIEIQPRPHFIPLSCSQERLWFIDHLEGSSQYHLSLVLRLKGHLNKPALVFAFKSIIDRHEVLRTVIQEEEGEPYQLIKEKDEWQLTIIDGCEYNEYSLQERIDDLIHQPFLLNKDYTLRAQLISLKEGDHILAITMHHIASDGWSFAILVKELSAFYNFYIEEKKLDLFPLALQYADYAIWQKRYLQGELLHKKINYWREQLQYVAPLQLPTDFPRPPVQSAQGASIAYVVEKELTEQLHLLSQQQGTTLFMTLLATFKVLLHRYSNQEDICIGTAISDRKQREVEELIGFFVNTLAIRSEVNGDESFLHLLQNVRTTILEAYENQEVPFEKVVEVVVKERDMSRNPLFQVMFVWQNTPPVPVTSLGEVQLVKEEIALTKTKFDLTFTITESDNGLQGTIEYRTDLYSKSTIERMAANFNKLLSSIIKNPHQNIGTLSILTEEEEDQLEVFNDTTAVYPKNKTIVQFFQEQATRAPGNIAIVSNGQSLTYHELNEKTNQLAYYLKSKGVTEETMVPICLKRSSEMIICMISILKAGGAYVPIDPDYPAERIAYMLEDTRATMLISSSGNSDKLQNIKGLDIIELNKDGKEIDKQPIANIENNLSPDHLAYVIYTSGSTGKPKGVMIEHCSLMNLIAWHNRQYQVSEVSRATSMAGVGFDAFGWEVWPYLAAGATIYIIDDEIRLDPGNLLQLINVNNITHSFISTALIPEFINISKHTPNALQFLITGGDKLSSLEKEGINYTVVNNYGPTEFTVVTTCYQLPEKNRINNPPIGKPISNAKIKIVNNQQVPVPIGVSGEIYIGGDSLARGYLNLNELTAEKFIDFPLGNDDKKRMYKSGDMGRWLADGNIEYMGRIDDQVKIRGYRIEPGEIENVLLQSKLVNQVIVLPKDDGAGNNLLVAYVVVNSMFNKTEIISYLQNKLPRFMIPSLWVEMESFPLTHNGKIDKQALPIPNTAALLSNEYVAPQTEIEIKLAAIWEELLHVEKIGVLDDFFNIGGHSLLAKRMASYIERKLLVSVPMQVLFQSTTIKELSKYLEIQLNVYSQEQETGYKFLNI